MASRARRENGHPLVVIPAKAGTQRWSLHRSARTGDGPPLTRGCRFRFQPMLTFASVTCIRGGRTLFADRSFALEAGNAVLVTGPNGAGKSSLIRVAAGLLRVAGGEVSCTQPRALLPEQAALAPELPLNR